MPRRSPPSAFPPIQPVVAIPPDQNLSLENVEKPQGTLHSPWEKKKQQPKTPLRPDLEDTLNKDIL